MDRGANIWSFKLDSYEPVSCIFDSSSSAVIEMSDNARKLFSVRKFRRIVCAMITRLETQILKLEGKPEITHSDSMMIQDQTEKLNSPDSDFKKHHFAIIELINEIKKHKSGNKPSWTAMRIR